MQTIFHANIFLLQTSHISYFIFHALKQTSHISYFIFHALIQTSQNASIILSINLKSGLRHLWVFFRISIFCKFAFTKICFSDQKY